METITKLIIPILLATGLVLFGMDKDESSFRVRIYVGGYGVFEAEIEKDERLLIGKNDLTRNGKKVSLIGELSENGFSEQLRTGSRNAQWSRRIREIQMLAINCGGRNSFDGYQGINFPADYKYSKKPENKISEEGITDVSVRDENGNTLFCGYIGSEFSKIQIENNRLIFVRAGSELASFDSIIDCAKVLNSELNGTKKESTLEFHADGVSVTQYSRFGSMVVLNDKKGSPCWWLAECDFRSLATHHLLRMKPRKTKGQNPKTNLTK